MNLTAIQSKVTRGNYVNVKKSVILSAEKEQPAENKVTGQQSESYASGTYDCFRFIRCKSGPG